MKLNEPMEFTMTIEDADLEVMAKILKDIKIPECPYFDVSDKYGNKARYYRENRWIPCSERLPEEDHWLGGSGRQFSDNVLISILNSADEDEWVDVSYTIDGEWTLELSRDCKVIAWKPLPEPYQPKEDES